MLQRRILTVEYLSPSSAKEASDLLAAASGRAHVLAGGTDLLVKMRTGLLEPQVVIDLKNIPHMRGVVVDGHGFRIGAATSCAELGEHAALKAAWPGLVEGLRLIGSTQIQGRATLGGKLSQISGGRRRYPRREPPSRRREHLQERSGRARSRRGDRAADRQPIGSR